MIARASDDKLVDERSLKAYAACYRDPETLITESGGYNFSSLTEAMIYFVKAH